MRRFGKWVSLVGVVASVVLYVDFEVEARSRGYYEEDSFAIVFHFLAWYIFQTYISVVVFVASIFWYVGIRKAKKEKTVPKWEQVLQIALFLVSGVWMGLFIYNF